MYIHNKTKWLLDHGLFPERVQYVCGKCLVFAKANLEQEKDKTKANTNQCSIGDKKLVEHVVIPEESDHSDDAVDGALIILMKKNERH